MALILKHQTAAQFARRVWLRLRAAQRSDERVDKQVADYICWRLYGWYQEGHFTVADLRNSYNASFDASLTQAQFTSAVVPKMLAARDRHQATIDAEVI